MLPIPETLVPQGATILIAAGQVGVVLMVSFAAALVGFLAGTARELRWEADAAAPADAPSQRLAA